MFKFVFFLILQWNSHLIQLPGFQVSFSEYLLGNCSTKHTGETNRRGKLYRRGDKTSLRCTPCWHARTATKPVCPHNRSHSGKCTPTWTANQFSSGNHFSGSGIFPSGTIEKLREVDADISNEQTRVELVSVMNQKVTSAGSHSQQHWREFRCKVCEKCDAPVNVLQPNK